MSSPAKIQKIKNTFKDRDFLKISSFSREELKELVYFAIDLKDKLNKGEPHRYLEGKTMAMIFEKSSTRTRVSFETGMYQLGGLAQFLSPRDIQLGNGETISDTTQVLSRYVDVIMIRTFGHDIVEELAESATVPVINGLTDFAHPCQVMADLMTIYEKKGSLNGLKFAFVGDGNNMTHSLLMGCAIMGIDCSIAVPKGHEVGEALLKDAEEASKISGAKIEQMHDPVTAVKNADVIYTDVWASMGFEGDKEELVKKFEGYQVNEELVQHAKDDYLFMHCLPAIRGEEVSAGVIDGPNSVVFDQAENRLHAQKAILASIV